MLKYVAAIVFVCSLLTVSKGSGQNTYPDPALNRPLRIEFPASSDKETYRVIPCSDQGMLIFYRGIETVGEDKVKWHFMFYDKNMQQSWSKSVPLNTGVDYVNYFSGADTLSLFFQSAETDRTAIPVFQVLRVIILKGAFILNNGEMPREASLSVFSVVRQICYAGFDIRNEQAQLMILHLPTGRQDFVTVGGGTQTSFAALEVDTSDMSVSAVVRKQLTKRFWDNYFVRMGPDGANLGETLITTMAPERQLAETRIYPLSASENLVAGTYVLTSSITDQQQRGASKATGFFIARFAGLTQSNVRYTNFLDLKSSEHFLSEREIIALRKKAVKKSRIEAEYSADLNLLVHDIIRHGDRFMILGESYYLQYHTESFTDFDFYGRPYTNSYSVFDGYRFTNAIVAAYDPGGNLLWDNSMEIRNLLSQNLAPKVTLTFSGGNAIMAYLSEGKIGYKIIKEGSTVEKTDYSDLELTLPDDRLVNETKSRMVPWYGNYFLCYGFQEIKNLSITGNATKLVFFCNKVQFE